MRTWIWIGARPAGGEGRAVGRHDEVGRSGEDAAALGIGEGQRGYLVPVNRPNIGDGRGRSGDSPAKPLK